MSDSEGGYSSSESESDNDDEVKTPISRAGAKKNVVPIVSKMAYDDDDEDDDEEEVDEVVGSDDEDDDEKYNKKALELDKKKISKIVGFQSDDEDEEDEDEDEDDDYEEDLDDKPKAKKSVKIAAQILQPPSLFNEDNDEEEEEEEDDENYLQKFDIDVNRNYINEFHPECASHNYDEIAKMSNVIRDDNGIIVDPFHKTIPFLTKYERARILGQRAKQIETGSNPFVKIPDNIIDGYLIAEMELEQKKIPFIIRRPLPNGGSEYWRLVDLEVIAF